jgi:flap endonuclease-1
MGVQLSNLLVKKEIDITFLNNKIIAIDTPLWLYQFISSIRQRDGTLLMDREGNVTSHLMGLFTRTSKLMQYGIKPVFVFDGKPPELKKKETEKRKQAKIEAEKKYKIAVKKKDIEDMKKYASRTSRLTKEMIDEAKDLIKAFGIPIVQAPSEGEAQASHIVKKNDAFCVASQDFDSLMFGATRVVRNLSLLGKRKKSNQLAYTTVEPELIIIKDVLDHLNINQDQLIVLGILVGTDYNNGGIKGIGPKNALKLVKEYKNNFDKLFSEVKWEFDVSWKEIFDIIKNIPVTDDYEIKWNKIDIDKLNELLIEKHNFSRERIESLSEKLYNYTKKASQNTLGDFF